MTDLTSSVVRNEKGASRRTKEDLNIKFKKKHWVDFEKDNDYNSEESVMLYEKTKQQRDLANETDTFSVQNLY